MELNRRMKEREVVLISGTRKGIGRFLVEYFIRKGYIVEGCSRKHVDFSFPNYTHHIVDVTDEGQVRGMVSSIKKRHGRLHIAINNAGIALMNHILLMPIGAVANIMNTNMNGTFLVCRESAKLMKSHHYGRIVNFSTIAVPMQLEGEAIYAASKSAVETFTKIIARELADFGITCNVVGPAPIATDLIRGVPSEKINNLINRLAIKRMSRFEDIANVIDFFVRPESDAVTGQVIYLGGL